MNRFPATRPAFAVNTMSGRPATGSSSSTVAPTGPVSVAYSASHWAIARSRSAPRFRSIHGLISYSMPKWSGGHIRICAMLPSLSQIAEQFGEERLNVRHQADRLMAAPVGQLGDHGGVDVHADRLAGGGQQVPGRD